MFWSGNPQLNFVSELAFEQNRDLANLYSARANGSFSDFVNAIDLVAMLMAQICYRPIMDSVWTELLMSQGSEVHCVGASLYVNSSEGPVPFWKLVFRVRQMRKHKGDICLGYITTEYVNGWARAKCVFAPPMDSQRVYTHTDKLVILAVDSPVNEVVAMQKSTNHRHRHK